MLQMLEVLIRKLKCISESRVTEAIILVVSSLLFSYVKEKEKKKFFYYFSSDVYLGSWNHSVLK